MILDLEAIHERAEALSELCPSRADVFALLEENERLRDALDAAERERDAIEQETLYG